MRRIWGALSGLRIAGLPGTRGCAPGFLEAPLRGCLRLEAPLRGCVVMFVLLVLSSCVSTPPPPVWHPVDPGAFERQLTLEDCLALARVNDLRTAEWQARLASARATIAQTKSLPNPTVTAEWEGIGLRSAEGKSLQSQLTNISFPILFWWPRAYERAAAEANGRAEAAAVHGEQRTLAAEIGGAWLGLVAGQRQIAVAKALRANAQESLRLATKGKALGIRSAYDVERAEAEVLSAEGDVAEAESQLRVDQLALAFALGASRPAFPQAADTPEAGAVDPSLVGAGETPPDDLLSLALAENPDWTQAHAQVEAAEAELHVQQLAILPFSDVRAGGGRLRDPEGRGGIANGEVPLPLLNWNGAGISKAEAELLSARTAEEKARRAVVSSLAQDWERVRAAVRRWQEFAHPLSEKLTKVEASARKLFDAGQIGYTELLQAQRDLETAEKSEVNVWRDAATARWTLESALGRHDPEPTGGDPAR